MSGASVRCRNHFCQSLIVIRVYFNKIFFLCVWIGFELLWCLSSLDCNASYEYMCYAIHAAPHAASGATCAQLCFVQHATCEFTFSHAFGCTNALCIFCKFCFVPFVPLLFALHCIAHAVFALLVDKAGVLRNCKFCSCNKANVFADAKCNYSPGNPTYLAILPLRYNLVHLWFFAYNFKTIKNLTNRMYLFGKLVFVAFQWYIVRYGWISSYTCIYVRRHGGRTGFWTWNIFAWVVSLAWCWVWRHRLGATLQCAPMLG